MTRASSRRRRAGIAARGALVIASLGALAAAGAPACRGLIGADEEDYEQVTEDMCVCADQLPRGFDTQEGCKAQLARRLNAADPDVTEAWLRRYAELCYGKDCGKISSCFYAVPVCTFGGCKEAEECCGFREGEVCGAAGLCEMPTAAGGGS